MDEKWFDVTITHDITLRAENAEKALVKAYKRIRDSPTRNARADVEPSPDQENQVTPPE